MGILKPAIVSKRFIYCLYVPALVKSPVCITNSAHPEQLCPGFSLIVSGYSDYRPAQRTGNHPCPLLSRGPF